MTTNQHDIDKEVARRAIRRIIELEKHNLQTRHSKDSQVVEKIKNIIREEVSSYAD